MRHERDAAHRIEQVDARVPEGPRDLYSYGLYSYGTNNYGTYAHGTYSYGPRTAARPI